MDRYDISVGTDPEVFLMDPRGRFVSAHDVLPGTKERPHKVDRGAVQVDGVAFEFNIDPASDSMTYLMNHKKVMKQGIDLIREKNPELKIKIAPTATFDREYFEELPHKVRELGCTPDYNAWTEDENDPPYTDEPFRTGGGHQHIGWGSFDTSSIDHWKTCLAMVKQLDACIYPTSVLWDDDDRRRTLYGKAGAFRPKSYGVEYRPMSNMFLSSNLVQRFMFEAVRKAASLLLNDGIEVFDSERGSDMMRNIRRGEKPSPEAVREYNRWLSKEFDFPLYLPMYLEGKL